MRTRGLGRTAVEVTVLVGAGRVMRTANPVGTVEGVVDGRRCVVASAHSIMVVDGEDPSAAQPAQRQGEVGQRGVKVVLPLGEHAAQVGIAVAVIGAKAVALSANVHKVSQVDFVGAFILLRSEVQLIRHLVGQEPGT